MTIALLGVLLLWVGWYGFNCGSTLAVSGGASKIAGHVAVTTTISAAASGMTMILYQRFIGTHYDLGAVGNAILAGLVSITAGCALVDPWAAFLIGIIGCLAYMLSSTVLLKLLIDDPLDAYPIHGFCGMWGVLAVGIFGTDKNAAWAGYVGSAAGEDPFKSGDQFAVQIMGVLAITAWVSVTAILMFGG
jgi:Amt family ammonium transporter